MPLNDMVDKIILGQRLKELRESAGLSQKQLAECLSVDQSMVSKFESGERSISATQLEAVCDIICYPIEKLLDEKHDVKPNNVISFRTAKLSIESIKALRAINRIFLNQLKMDKWESVQND